MVARDPDGDRKPTQPHSVSGMATARARGCPPPHGDRKGPPGRTPPPSPLLYTSLAIGQRPVWGVAWHERTTRPFVTNLATPNALVV